jgi:hypothetical protein
LLKYSRYSHSPRLAIRVPRSEFHFTDDEDTPRASWSAADELVIDGAERNESAVTGFLPFSLSFMFAGLSQHYKWRSAAV